MSRFNAEVVHHVAVHLSEQTSLSLLCIIFYREKNLLVLEAGL